MFLVFFSFKRKNVLNMFLFFKCKDSLAWRNLREIRIVLHCFLLTSKTVKNSQDNLDILWSMFLIFLPLKHYVLIYFVFTKKTCIPDETKLHHSYKKII